MTGRGLLERALLGIAAFAIFVLLFFFLAAALVLAAVMVVILLARFWWLKRSLGRAEESGPITAEYTVIERERAPQPRLPDDNQPAGEHGASGEEQARRPER
jgi:uncharacterized protein (DUF58 family)